MNTYKLAILKNYTQIYAKIIQLTLKKSRFYFKKNKKSKTSPKAFFGAGVGSRAPVQQSQFWAWPGRRILGRWRETERDTKSGQIKREKG